MVAMLNSYRNACWLVVLVMAGVCAEEEPQYSDFERSHWSFQRLATPSIPQFDDAKDRERTANPIDAFILKKLRTKGLKPAPMAERRTLIRRLSFSLNGLPPTPDQVDRFTADQTPGAYQRLVDRLLTRPAYGEHFGQMWLDVARFSETEGFEYDRTRHGAWRYRDYVIQSLGADKPFNVFVTEQLAGDELATPTDTQLAAAGFHRLGPIRRNAGNPKVAFSRNEVLTERTDAVGAVFLGLTVGCARCHDHMFDPIRQRDYYQLQAYLGTTYEFNKELASDQQKRDWQRRTDAINDQISQLRKQLTDAKGDQEAKLKTRVAKLEAELPQPLAQIATIRNDPKRAPPIRLLKRGNEDLPQDEVGRRFLGVLLPENAPAEKQQVTRPRTQLAAWLTRRDHPLTPRVIVNRIWQFHFGQGLIPTPNDLGFNGQAPAHPELLDFLAQELIRNDWQLKSIHRLIVTSNTYRQSSRVRNQRAAKADAKNELWWKYPRRRLRAEEIRDAMLSITGTLNREKHGPSVMVPVDAELVKLLYKPSQWQVTSDVSQHHRRSVYLMSKRNLRHPFLQVFDQPDTQTSCFQRQSSTHAPQALEMLNGELSNRLASLFALRLEREAGSDKEQQIQLAFQLAAGRAPTEREVALSRRFLESEPLHEFALAVFSLNSFLYVE